MTKKGLLGLAVIAIAGPEAVVAQTRVASVAKAMPTRYIEPTCELRPAPYNMTSV